MSVAARGSGKTVVQQRRHAAGSFASHIEMARVRAALQR